MAQSNKQEILNKLKVFEYAKACGNISKACRYYGISRETYYEWHRKHKAGGEEALINRRPGPTCSRLRTAKPIEEQILYLRSNYHFGQQRISWYLSRYHNIKISPGGVRQVLLRNNMNRLPINMRKRSIKQFKRYEKQVPGHRIQIDVKFLSFQKEGKEIKRYQYTAIDDATRARALKIYERHNQANAIDFLNYVTIRFPFRIHTVQTDNGHEFQAKFHWHCLDLGMNHVYIRPRSPHLNGKVERSHATDKIEFYQLVSYIDDIDINKKIQEWEIFYNCHRPHSALKGKTPFEVLKLKLAA